MKAFTILTFILLVACKHGDSGTSSPATASIDKLGLRIQVPAAVKIKDDEMIGTGTGVRLAARSLDDDVLVSVDNHPTTLDGAKERIAILKPRDVQVETLADGFALTYMTTGTLGDRYDLDVFRTIAGKPTHCGFAARTSDARAQLLAACKTLAAI